MIMTLRSKNYTCEEGNSQPSLQDSSLSPQSPTQTCQRLKYFKKYCPIENNASHICHLTFFWEYIKQYIKKKMKLIFRVYSTQYIQIITM